MNYYYIIAIFCTGIAIIIQITKPKKKIYQWIAGICTVGVMVLSYIAAKKDGEVSETSLKEMITYQNSEVKRLSEQNIALTQVIYNNTNQMTGNGSYPVCFLGGGKEKETQILIQVNGKYALPNLTAKIVSLPNYKNISGLDLRTLGLTNPTIPLGTIRKNELRSQFVESKTKETAVTFFFKSDNHSWIQSIRIVQTPKGRKAFWFIQNEDGKIIDKYIDNDFPKTKDGKVVIWSNEIKSFEEI